MFFDWYAVLVDRPSMMSAAFAAICGLIGAGLATVVVFRPANSVHGFHAEFQPALSAVLISVGIGAGIGGVVGLVIGLCAYLPTAPFALVEGSMIGGVLGTVVGVPVAFMTNLSRRWSHR